MKTRNLTKWSNLYLTELKCNIKCQPSVIVAEIWLAFLTIGLVSFNFITVEIAVNAWAYCLLIVSISLLIRLTLFQYLPQHAIKLSLDAYHGIVEYQVKTYLLHAKSKSAFYGYYLYLKEEQQIKAKQEKLLIDKRQLTKQQQAILNYAIKKQQAVAANAATSQAIT